MPAADSAESSSTSFASAQVLPLLFDDVEAFKVLGFCGFLGLWASSFGAFGRQGILGL